MELGITYGVPWLAKKGVEAGRYYASEAMRDPNIQKKLTNYAIKKAKPIFNKSRKAAFDELANYIEPESVKRAKREGRWKGSGLTKKDVENFKETRYLFTNL